MIGLTAVDSFLHRTSIKERHLDWGWDSQWETNNNLITWARFVRPATSAPTPQVCSSGHTRSGNCCNSRPIAVVALKSWLRSWQALPAPVPGPDRLSSNKRAYSWGPNLPGAHGLAGSANTARLSDQLRHRVRGGFHARNFPACCHSQGEMALFL